MLFLLAMCVAYGWQDGRRLLVLLTAFTCGHAITLVWTAYAGPVLPPYWVELLIPATIIGTCISNVLIRADRPNARGMGIRYALALSFGFIHGMGFGSYFQSLLGAGPDLAVALLGFNLGVELGQIFCVALYLGLVWAGQRWLRLRSSWVRWTGSAVAGAVALWMMVERLGS
jgi:hypothetical protein